MRSMLMQGWTTVSGNATTLKTIIQGEDQWLDLSPYQDCAFWIDCRETTGSPSLAIETAPALDDTLFAPLVGPFALAVSAVPVVMPALMASASTPLARFVRWKLTTAAGSGSFDATFRIWVAAAVPGL
jgi:hypothetical protein